MRYRYHVRNAGGEILSRHSSYTGALDALASMRRRAQRDGQQSGEYIYDVARQARIEDPLGTLIETAEAADLLVRLTPEEKAQLRRIAAQVGAWGQGGRVGTGPSIHRLVRQIASGELVVSRRAE